MIEAAADFDSDLIEVACFNEMATRKYLESKMMGDIMISAFLMIFVISYMTFHMRSLFLSLFSMLNISMSIPISLIIYKFLF